MRRNEEPHLKNREQEKKEQRERKHHPFSSIINPGEENFRFQKIERSDRRDCWSAALQHLGRRFGRLDCGFEVWRSSFLGVLHNSVFGDIFSSLFYFGSIHLDVLISVYDVLYASSII